MTKREKYQYTYENVQSRILSLERELANILVDNSRNFEKLELNTVMIQQRIGALIELRDLIYK